MINVVAPDFSQIQPKANKLSEISKKVFANHERSNSKMEGTNYKAQKYDRKQTLSYVVNNRINEED
jgi:hypothetical protein